MFNMKSMMTCVLAVALSVSISTQWEMESRVRGLEKVIEDYEEAFGLVQNAAGDFIVEVKAKARMDKAELHAQLIQLQATCGESQEEAFTARAGTQEKDDGHVQFQSEADVAREEATEAAKMPLWGPAQLTVTELKWGIEERKATAKVTEKDHALEMEICRVSTDPFLSNGNKTTEQNLVEVRSKNQTVNRLRTTFEVYIARRNAKHSGTYQPILTIPFAMNSSKSFVVNTSKVCAFEKNSTINVLPGAFNDRVALSNIKILNKTYLDSGMTSIESKSEGWFLAWEGFVTFLGAFNDRGALSNLKLMNKSYLDSVMSSIKSKSEVWFLTWGEFRGEGEEERRHLRPTRETIVFNSVGLGAISGVVIGLVTLLIVDLLCPRMRTLIAQF